MGAKYDIRPLKAAEIRTACVWAAAEGWNPGRQDAACFSTVDPKGFWGGFLNGEMAACISVVNYGADFAFLGFYIVKPEWRGKGLGYALWQRALDHAGTRTVGLDGVVDQQSNYRTSGFELAWNNIRYGGVPAAPSAAGRDLEISPLASPSADIEDLDARVFPASRTGFWAQWFAADGHVSLQARRKGRLCGFGTIRPCGTGWKIGPLTAEDASAAQGLAARLLEALPDGQEVFLDVPEPHREAVSLAQDLGLSPVFETARMYKGPAPALSMNRVFGVTTFELG
jgi:GNAT superfamily N-acetyltransferase